MSKGPKAWSPFYREARPVTPLYRIGKFRIVRCNDSGLVFLANPLSGEELHQFYSREYFEGETSRKGYSSYSEDEAILRANFRDYLRRLRANCRECGVSPAKSRLLDYGCAYGYFLDEARGSFASVRGIELNEEVAQVGREKFGLTIESQPELAHGGSEGELDVITMWDVIEHLPDPSESVAQAAKALRKGGLLAVTTGDIGTLHARLLGHRWRLINPPQHISYFSTKTLRRLLERNGFEVTFSSTCGKYVSFRFIFFILSYLLRIRNLSTMFPRLANLHLRINLFDVVFMIAKKR
jgi:SAM-dependent methyltransferase